MKGPGTAPVQLGHLRSDLGSVKMAIDIPFDLAKHPQEDFDIARFQADAGEEAAKIAHHPIWIGAVQKSDAAQYLLHAGVEAFDFRGRGEQWRGARGWVAALT